MKLSLAECHSQYHQLNKARLKQETKPVNAVLQMQPISEENFERHGAASSGGTNN